MDYYKKSDMSIQEFCKQLNLKIVNKIPLKHYEMDFNLKGTDTTIIDNFILTLNNG